MAIAAGIMLLLGAAQGQGGPAPKPPERRTTPILVGGLPPPGYLSPVLYELLHRRMERHAADMSRLVNLVVLLRYDEISAISESIATEPRLSRPLPGEMEDLNAQLPERFFLLQEQLRERARALTEAARAKNDAALSAAFGRLTEACVACHAAYRHDPGRTPIKK